MRHFLIDMLDRFRRNEDGTVAVELCLMTPIIVWCTVATVSFFDGYRARFSAEKATTTVADLISRESVTLDNDYIDGAFDLLSALVYRNEELGLRITVVEYDAVDPDEDFDPANIEVAWSEVRGTVTQRITDGNLVDYRSKFPVMADGQHFIFVETFAGYSKRFDPIFFASALEDFDIHIEASISPRFTSKLCFRATTGSALEC